MDVIGISAKTLDAILNVISISHQKARRQASRLRAGPGHTGYKRSLFRECPCIAFGSSGERVRALLPDLVILRATSGLFYDFVKGSENIRNEIAHRFETYCLHFLNYTLPTYKLSGSFNYYLSKSREIESPDVLVSHNSAIKLILECKTTRMSYEARFSEDPVTEASRGYEAIAKGVFQIWRFVSHHRRGFVGCNPLESGAKGIVLTLDTWLAMANTAQSDVLDLAHAMCKKRDLEIVAADQIPVTFCPIDDLEETLRDGHRDIVLPGGNCGHRGAAERVLR